MLQASALVGLIPSQIRMEIVCLVGKILCTMQSHTLVSALLATEAQPQRAATAFQTLALADHPSTSLLIAVYAPFRAWSILTLAVTA